MTEFEQICLASRPQLQRLALRLVKSFDDAEDLVQETYRKVLEAPVKPEMLTRGHAENWLKRVMKNEYVSGCRLYYTSKKYNASWHELTSNEMRPDRYHTSQGFQRLFASIPQRFQEVLVSHVIVGKSTKEISEELGIPIGTVFTRLLRGRKLLREQLECSK